MTTTLPHDHGGADVEPPDDVASPDVRTPSADGAGGFGGGPVRSPARLLDPVPDPAPDPAPEGRPEGLPGRAPDTALGEAAERLQSWRAERSEVAGRPRDDPGREGRPDPAPWPAVGATGGRPPGVVSTDEDELAARLHARRSARHVAAAYTAAHGHPVDGHDDGGGPRRWSLGLRAAVVASVAVLLVAVVVAVVATARPDDVITLAGAAPAATAAASASPRPSTAAASATSGDSAPSSDRGASPEAVPSPGTVVVHVVGEVREPGLVTVPSGARVADALAAAGGTTRRADAAALNLARAVVDGEQIRVPKPGEQVPAAGVAPDGGGEGDLGAIGGASSTSPGGAVSLNSAAAADLEVLPGIGPALAGRIVAWREENGPFTSVDELDEVSGIGPSVLAQVRDLVTL